jgi:hypothetical protein
VAKTKNYSKQRRFVAVLAALRRACAREGYELLVPERPVRRTTSRFAAPARSGA